MKYLLNTFMDESKNTRYPNSVTIRYCINGGLIIGYAYRNSIPMQLMKKHVETAKMLLGANIDAIIKVNH